MKKLRKEYAVVCVLEGSSEKISHILITKAVSAKRAKVNANFRCCLSYRAKFPGYTFNFEESVAVLATVTIK